MNTNKLANLIDGKKITKSKVVKSAGISLPTLNAILDGKDFKVSNLEKIARALKLPVGYFFDDYEADNSKISLEGQFNAQTSIGDPTVIVGDAVLVERIKSLEILLEQKDETIKVLNKLVDSISSK